MEKLYVTFRVNVRDTEWEHNSDHKGGAEIEMQVPRWFLEKIEPGNLFLGVLQGALAEFDAPPTEEGDAD